MKNKMASSDPSITLREIKHNKISTQIAQEGIVLLENKGVLPFSDGINSIALFGNGARRTIKGGTGSGDVNSRDFVTVERGLKKAGFSIVTNDYLSEQSEFIERAKRKYDERIKSLSTQGVAVALLTMMGNPFVEPEFRAICKEDLMPADAAIYVLSRISGEGADRKVAEGDYLLTKNEKEDIKLLSKTYRNFVLILNVGAVVDIEDIRSLPGAVVLMGQAGNGSGDAITGVLTGEVNPSGKLAATWAKHYTDYPFSDEFAATGDNISYKEGIFVGYRWFDSFSVKPRYPFGYGLSYTSFDIKTRDVYIEGEWVYLDVCVKNTGALSGKETVQVYACQPCGKLIKPKKVLAAFKKTKLLLKNEEQHLNLSFPLRDLASYDEDRGEWILERGEYGLYVGNSSENISLTAALVLEREVVCEKCKNLFRNRKIDEVQPFSHSENYTCNKLLVDSQNIRTITNTYTDKNTSIENCGKKISFGDVLSGKATCEQFVGTLSKRELSLLCIGGARVNFSDFSVIGNASKSIPGAAGDTTDLLENYGVPQCSMADGPAGIRVNPKIYERTDGYINNIAEDPIMSKILPPELQKVDLSGTTLKYQYCTALPVATVIAQTWNLELIELAGDLIGEEMDELGIDLWLAPALNIQRNPLCGRNFEYYSEDPLLSGKFAAAMTKGVQKHRGKGVCIKHLAANNQETNRATSSSNVSERTLREIYLKGFELCVKESHPFSAMSSMNLINGVHTAADGDLLVHALRDEWGFDGIVMTDWGVTGRTMAGNKEFEYPPASPIGCIAAGNDLIMPGTQFDEDSLIEAAEEGSLAMSDLQKCAVRIIELLTKCAKSK